MKKRSLASLGAVAPMLFLSAAVAHADGCSFDGGFATLSAAIPDVVGQCVEDQYGLGNGSVAQHTTTGLLVWSPANNLPEFTDGSQTWVLGPNGVDVRGNDTRFPYEAPQGQVAGTVIPHSAPSSNVVGYITSLINAGGVDHPVSTTATIPR